MIENYSQYYYSQLSDGKELRRGGLSLSVFGLGHRLDPGAECLAEILFACFGDLGLGLAVELKSEIVEDVFGGEPHPDQVADARGAAVAVFERLLDSLNEFAMAGFGVNETHPELSHAREYRLHRHKTTQCTESVQSAPPGNSTQTYNTQGTVVTPKRSTLFLGNAPGRIPGCRLGLARFAKLTMLRHARRGYRAIGIDNGNHYAIAGGRGR